MNKYKGINPEIAYPPSRAPEIVEGGFDGGIVLNVSPMMIELNQSPSLDKVRIEKGGLRQEYGVDNLGSPANTTIRALGEYRRIESGATTYEAFFRAYTTAQTNNTVEIDRWDGSSWVSVITGGGGSSLELERVPVDWISALDAVFFADGVSVLKWDREISYTDQNDTFGAGNSLTSEGDSTDATINPADASEDKYDVHFEMTIDGPSDDGAVVTIQVLDNASDVLKETEYEIPISDNTNRSLVYDHETVPVTGVFASGHTLTLKLSGIQQSQVKRTNDLSLDGDATKFNGSKDPNRESQSDYYTYYFSLSGTKGSTCDVQIRANAGGGGWSQEDELTGVGPGVEQQCGVTVLGMGAGSEFEVTIDNIDGDMMIDEARVEWYEPYEVTVHGFEEPNPDDDYGVTYKTESVGATDDLFRVDNGAGAPTNIIARYLGYFADRVVALQYDDGSGTIDPQKIAWCISGDDTDWVGSGSGETILESRSDPIDKLMALKPFSSNIAALFRERSIMRVTATGRLEPALAFFPWIEQLGTESPFSCEVVPGGVMFLGHDRMVYYLSESGLKPVGQAIQDEFYRTVGDLHSVEGTYDPIGQDYILAVPAETGSTTAVSWIFDTDRFARTGEKVWFKHTRTMNRLAVVQGENIVWSKRSNVYRYDRDSVTNDGYWTSPILNRKDRMGEYSLYRVVLRYETESSAGWGSDKPEIKILASGDGGQNWDDGYKSSFELDSTEGSTLRVAQGFNVTGPDLRFRVYISDVLDAKIYLKEWRAELIDRGSLESDT